MHENNLLKVSDGRSDPFYRISRAFIAGYAPTWRAIIAYSALAYYADRTDRAAIGLRIMAARFNVSEDTMKRGLAELVKKKAILKREQRRKNKKTGKHYQLPSMYTLIDLRADDEKEF